MDIKDIKDARVTHAGLLQHNSDGSTELQKITHAGLIARSAEGTAAKGMNIRGNEDLWVEIQANTFRNWVNEHLKDADMQVSDWTTDFCDGTHLCALVEILQKRPLKPAWNRRPGNQHHFLENATVALNAIEHDGIKLVNIGNVDIVNGNVKLILGLIWSLIVRYQIGRSKFPPRKLMLAWLQAALPDCRINNLTTDWNSGVNLSALLEYCEPGLFPHWRTVDPAHSVRNCETAMNIALREFGVPKVLEPEYLASPWLDELSGMTYLSYFMKVGGPGYKATMRWVNGQTRRPVTNFTTDWNDGRVFSELVKDLGGPAPDPDKLSIQQHNWESNITKAVTAGKQLGVTPILTPKDMANPDVEHLGIMSYAANLQYVTPRPPLSNLLAVHLESNSGRVGEPTYFTVELLTRDINLSDVRAYVVSPAGHTTSVKIGDNGQCSYVPDKYGMHEILLEIDDQRLGGHFFRVLPRYVHVAPPGMAPCALGSLVEVLVNATGAPKTEDILVTAYSPTGRSLHCPLKNVGADGHSAIFKPDEAGVWQIAITYQGRHIQGGPFTCSVFDPNGVSVHGLDGAMPLRAHSFEVDARGVGVPGELHVDIVHEKHSLVCSVEKLVENKYRVTFMPRTNGKYRVYVYFNGYDVKGSPYIMRVGTKGRSGKTRSGSREPGHSSRDNSPATARSSNQNSGSSSKLNDFRTVKKELYAQDANSGRQFSAATRASPIQEETSSSSMYKTKEFYTNKRPDTYSPQPRSSPLPHLHSSTSNLNQSTSSQRRETSYSPLPPHTEALYSTSLKSPLAKTPSYNNDYYYHKEPELNTRKHDEVDGSRSPPRQHLHESTTTSSVSKNYSSEKYVTSGNNHSRPHRNSESFEPLEVHHVTRSISPLVARHSPVTVTTQSRYESTSRNVHSSSPAPRRESPASPAGTSSHYITQSSHRVASPQTSYNRVSSPSPLQLHGLRVSSPAPGRSSPSATTYKVTEESSSYKRTNNVTKEAGSPSYYGAKPLGGYDSVDSSPNIRVSKGQAGRRDSWDVINKTKHLLSHNSLESLANMTEGQLNTDLSYSRPSVERDIETERNTRFNKYSLSATEKLGAESRRSVDSDRVVRVLSPSPAPLTSRNYSSSSNAQQHHIIKEDRQHYVSNSSTSKTSLQQNSDDDYGYVSRFRPIERDASGGARAIHVQDIPDGVLGRPVSFEIDGSRAGSGNLEILVNGGRVTSSVRALGTQRFVASFTPHEIGRHTVQITFNDETVPGSPWHVDIMSSPGLTPLGESTRLVPAHSPAVFEILPPPGHSLTKATACVATVQTPSKAKLNARVTNEAANGALRIEFVPTEVGTHIVEAALDGVKLVGGPLVAKVYDTGLIQVTEVNGGVVGQPCQFRVDASAAGEGQLEISINEGEVPNHVQVVGGGRCLVSFTPEQAKSHYIDIKFNGETVRGCPFVCAVADTSRVLLNLANLELIPVSAPATFHIAVSGGGPAELAVSVRGPHGELPVRVTGDVHVGFTSEFTPTEVGTHAVSVEYNGYPVQGTPFQAKSYDASRVAVGAVTQGTVGRAVQFTVDAGDAGEGNLEITISAKGHNIPTQVHPQGNAKFAVSFVPAEPTEHVINVSFNKQPVPGCPIAVAISGGLSGPQVSLGGPGPVHLPNSLVINHAGGRLEDVEVNVEGPSGQSVPAQVSQTAEGIFKADFVPRLVGEHRVSVTVQGQPTAGSPYAAKVYDVTAIKVKNVSQGTVGKSVTFLVETSQAGPGNLEVTVNGGRVPTSAQAQGQHTYAISFTPREAQHHTVELRFNGQDVPGSPFTCKVSAAARIVAADTLDKICVGRAFEFAVESDVQPLVEVLGPARRSVPATVEPATAGSGAYRIEFEPIDVGDHSVEVRLPTNDHVEGSPFLLKAYSAEKVIVTDIRPGVIGKSVAFGINASQAGAGNLEIIVAVAGKNVPNFVQSEGNARFKVNFKPTEAASHSLSVRFNGHAVPGSPFSCHIAAAPVSLTKASASGEALRQAAIDADNVFELDGFEAGGGVEPQVQITTPAGDTIPCRLAQRDDVYVCSFRPLCVGRHLISVTAAGGGEQHITGSPFSCNVFDVARVSISGLEQHSGPATLGAPVTFSVDAAGAGEGTLELVVSTATSTVKAEVVACARGLYDVTFVPLVSKPHFVHITFNDVPVDGNPFQIDVQQTTQYLQLGDAGTVENLTEDHRVEVVGPDGKVLTQTPLYAGAGTVEFRPSGIGAYTVRMLDVDTGKVVGSRTVNVFDAAQVRVVEVGEAFCGRAAAVALSVVAAGSGRLTAQVRCGAREVAHTVRGPSKSGVWEVLYHPQTVAPHRIAVLFNDVPVLSQPIEINVLPALGQTEIGVSGLGLYQSRVGKTTSFAIDTMGRAAREFDVVVSGPGGEALPVRCYQTKGGHLQAEYTINKIGQCLIEVLHQSKPLPGSPFTCESFDPTRIVAHGVTRGQQHVVHQPVSFVLSTADSGHAEFEATCSTASGQMLPVRITSDSDGSHHIVEFTPHTCESHRLTVTYGGEPVAGSPLHYDIGSAAALAAATATNNNNGNGNGYPNHNNQQQPANIARNGDAGGAVRASGTGLEVAHRAKEAAFVVFGPAAPNVQIERIDEAGDRVEARVKQLGAAGGKSSEWRVAYTLLAVGVYEVRVACPARGPVPGSPWTVHCVDTGKVMPVGGWGGHLDADGRLVLPARFVFDISAQAGPGELVCTVDGRELAVTKQSDGKSSIFIPVDGLAAGEYNFDLTFAGASVSQSPRSAYVSAQQHTAHELVTLTGRGLAAAQSGEPAHFTIDASDAPAGRPEVLLTYAADNTVLAVSITQPRATEAIWQASYTPVRSGGGPLTLTVKWNGRVVKGCPLTVAVGSSVDATKVLCSGEGLRNGVVGREIRSWIDTRRAGPGELSAHCAGPRKVAYCELYDHGDATFTLNVKPQEAGRHLLTIKYGGQHVTGSPFALKVAGAPDASKVRVYGPGIEHGVLATFQSRFICDTRGAGAGQLTVRVRGPKGAFRVEMQRESQKDRTILCKYDPTEPGDYRVEVKWAGELVPGSPFPVMIFDTEEELRRFMQGAA